MKVAQSEPGLRDPRLLISLKAAAIRSAAAGGPLLRCRFSTMSPHRLRRGALHPPARCSRQNVKLLLRRPLVAARGFPWVLENFPPGIRCVAYVPAHFKCGHRCTCCRPRPIQNEAFPKLDLSDLHRRSQIVRRTVSKDRTDMDDIGFVRDAQRFSDIVVGDISIAYPDGKAKIMKKPPPPGRIFS
jgi:hypothetical protein